MYIIHLQRMKNKQIFKNVKMPRCHSKHHLLDITLYELMWENLHKEPCTYVTRMTGTLAVNIKIIIVG